MAETTGNEQENNQPSEITPDEMETEWEKMLGSAAEANDGDEPYARVLNQDELDKLLGFDDIDRDAKSGIQAILNAALVSYDRLPLLEMVLDRFVNNLNSALRDYFGEPDMDVSIDNILSMRYQDYMNSVPLPIILAPFRANEWDGHCLFNIDSSLIYSAVDVLSGGNRGTAAMRIEGRPFSNIERRLIEDMIRTILPELSKSFIETPVSFTQGNLETNPRFVTIVRPCEAIIVAKLRIDMCDRGGRLELIIPYSTVEPVRENLIRFTGFRSGGDKHWTAHMQDELIQADAIIEAVLGTATMRVDDLLKLEVGSTIDLGKIKPVSLMVGGKEIFSGTNTATGTENHKIVLERKN